MGCGGSKSSRLNNVDDSVHVMLKHDKKVQQRKGQPVHGYKPRAPHPLLTPNNDDNNNNRATAVGEGIADGGGEEMNKATANTTNNNNITYNGTNKADILHERREEKEDNVMIVK